MRALALVLVIEFTSPALTHDYLWFERDWISDAAATFAANPALEKLTDNGRERFRALFGKMWWHVGGGMLESTSPDLPPYTNAYTIRAIDENSFELMVDNGMIVTVRRRGDGFCLVPDIAASGGVKPQPYVVECFAPLDP